MHIVHRNNLQTLADYLSALPHDYDHFDMGVYFARQREVTSYGDDEEDDVYYAEEMTVHEVLDNPGLAPDYECGSAACAVGHGPAAGIPVSVNDNEWSNYADRVFGTNPMRVGAGNYMFGGSADNPRCPQAAARRIREVLAGKEFN